MLNKYVETERSRVVLFYFNENFFIYELYVSVVDLWYWSRTSVVDLWYWSSTSA